MSIDTPFIETQLRFYMTVPHDCSYLKDHTATTLFLDPEQPVNQHIYNLLTLVGFRRSGKHLYRPNCKGCNACVSVRVPTESFQLKRKHRKTLNRNKDLSVKVIPARFVPEHYDLYERYINERHADGDMYPPTEDQYRSFLTLDKSFCQLVEFRDPSGKLVAVSAMDTLNHGISAIYTFFDPDQPRRSLGVFVVLWLILHARYNHLPFVYLGYWIESCSKMNYKTEYQPLEQLKDNHWYPLTLEDKDSDADACF